MPRTKQPTKKELDRLWAECVKTRAKHRCEYSGKTGNLHAHHIAGKASYRLRWELDNGICLTGGIHKFVAHRQDRALEFAAWAMLKRGVSPEKLKLMKNTCGATDKEMVRIYLLQKLSEFKIRESEDEAMGQDGVGDFTT